MFQGNDVTGLILPELCEDPVTLELQNRCGCEQRDSEHVVPGEEVPCEDDVALFAWDEG